MFCQMGAWNSSVSCSTKLIWSRSERIVTSRMSVPSIRDGAGGRIVEASEQVDDGRLAAAGRADERRDLSGLDREADVVENLLDPGCSRTTRASNAIVPLNGAARAGVPPVAHAAFGLQDFVDPLETHGRLRHRVASSSTGRASACTSSPR